MGINVEDLTWYHLLHYGRNKLNIVYSEPEGFDWLVLPSSMKKTEGVTVRGGIQIMTYINVHYKSFSSYRKNFTYMHELYHAIAHYEYDEEGVPYKDIIMDDDLKENQANVGGAYLMANDEAIRKCIHGDMSFDEMRYRFKYSNNGMYSRLIDYVTFSLQRNKEEAFDVVNAYRSGDSSFLKVAQDIYDGWTETMRQEMIREYANEMRGYY